MTLIQIQEAKQKVRTINFLGWTDRDQRRAFFARSETEQPLRASINPVCPPNGRFLSNPVPDREIVEIVPYRLLPPPCRANKAQANLDNRDNYFEPWERVYGACMYLDDADEKPLRKRWEDFKKRAREAYEEEKNVVSKLTADDYRFERYGAKSRRKVTQAELQKWRKVKLATVETIFNGPHKKFGRCDTAGYLNLTFDMVKDGAGNIRNNYLHDLWAAERNIDPLKFAQERERFKQYIKNNVQNVIKRIYNITHREKTFKPDLDMRWPDWQCLFASVRYRARFDDGSFVYLSDFVMSNQLTPAELTDVKLYEPACQNRKQTAVGLRVNSEFTELLDGDVRIELNHDPREIIRAAIVESKKPGADDHPCVDLAKICNHLKAHGKLTAKWPTKNGVKDVFNNQAELRGYFARLFKATHETDPKKPKYHKHYLKFSVV
ncbi:MAG: hypothetical protein PHW60_13760 [Kiritimatiellae bacterium]|nr:hypothetical protein [Kiritimatiellia bacterium]